jgi:hypothetical protein
MKTFRALMSPQPTDGRWRLFVVLSNAAGLPWPEFVWSACSPVPSPAQRRDALARLGYEPVPGVEWQWQEADPAPDSVAVVKLIASLDVHLTGGEQQ